MEPVNGENNIETGTGSEKNCHDAGTNFKMDSLAKDDKPYVDKPNVDKPNVDKPYVDKLNVDKPNVDKPNVDKPNVDKPNVDKPNVDKPNVDKPNVDKPNVDKTNVDKPNVDKPNADTPIVDRPNVDKPIVDKPNVDKPNVDKPNADKPYVDKPNVDKPNVDMPNIDKPNVDKGYAYVIDIASFSLQFLLAGYVRSSGVLFVEFQNQFHSNSTMTSLTVAISEAANSISSFLFLGFVLKKTSPRFLSLMGSLFLFLGVAGNYFANGVSFLIFTHGVCFGMAQGMGYGASLVVISDYFEKRRALATSIAMMGSSVGGSTLPVITRYLLDQYGFHGGFLMLGGIMCHSLIFSMLLFPVKDSHFTDQSVSVKPIANGSRGYGGKNHEEEREYLNSVGDVKESLCGEEERRYEHQICLPTEEFLFKDGVVGKNDVERQIPASHIIAGHAFKEDDKTRGEQSQHSAIPSSLGSNDVMSVVDDVVNESLNQKPFSTNVWQSSVDHICSNPSDALLHRYDDTDRLSCRCHDGNNLERRRDLTADHNKDLSSQQLQKRTSSLFHHSIADLSMLSVSVIELKPTTTASDPGNKASCLDICREFGQRVYAHPLTRSASFWLLLVFYLVSWVGFCVSMLYIPALIKERGLSDDDGAFFASLMSLLDIPSRLVPGIIVHAGYLKATSVSVLPLTAVGLVGFFTPLMNTYNSLLSLVIVYGLFNGVYVAMQSLVVIDMVGLKHYPFVLAVCYMAMGFATTTFLPITGFLKDTTGTYSTPYHLISIMNLASVVMLLCLPLVKRFDVRRGVLE